MFRDCQKVTASFVPNRRVYIGSGATRGACIPREVVGQLYQRCLVEHFGGAGFLL